MAKISIPYVAWRDGRPRFSPGPRERALGFVSQDLKVENRWLNFLEAKAWADAKAAEIAVARSNGKSVKKAGRTLADLLDDWFSELARDAKLGREHALKDNTVEGYRRQKDAIVFKPQAPADRYAGKPRELEAFGKAPVAAIGVPEIKQFLDYQIERRGLHMARASRAVLSAAFTWGRLSTKWRLPNNPASDYRMRSPAPRTVIYTADEISALVAAADALGRPSIGDAVMLGLFTGQRQGDRLSLVDVGLQDGRRVFRQGKTNVVVAIRETPQLAERLAGARARVAALTLRLGLRERPAEIVIDETTARPYVADTYRHVFDDVRRFAANLAPELAEKRDQDLRDTAVTWLARAGATLPEISAITGHSLASIHTIMKHYLAITPELGDAGIEKLKAWMAQQGMRV